MKEHPLLFSTEMVKALLEGRKTMTRRIIKPQPIIDEESGFIFDGKYHKQYDIHNWKEQFIDDWSRWMPEDLIWVRESWNVEQFPVSPEGDHDELLYYYKATEQEYTDMRWRPSIFMPKEACRIRLRIVDVRVERLQDISAGDACDEGVEYWNIDAEALDGGELQADFKNYTWTEKKEYDINYEDRWFPTFANSVDSFRSLWQSINGMESWNSNPWVWVIEFDVVKSQGLLSESSFTVHKKMMQSFNQ